MIMAGHSRSIAPATDYGKKNHGRLSNLGAAAERRAGFF
jgi:hypothetical protein